MSEQELLQDAIPIIQAMEMSELVYNDSSGDLECHYCNLACHHYYTLRPAPLEHDRDCPIHLAAVFLEKWRKLNEKSSERAEELRD